MDRKYVIAFLIEESDGKFLLAQRNEFQAEYPGAWSLPSRRISSDEFNSIDSINRIAHDVLCSIIDIEKIISFDKVAISEKDRSKYSIGMMLFHVKISGKIQIKTEKYTNIEWIQPDLATNYFPNGSGMCVMMAVRYLIEINRLNSAVNIFEIPPENYGDIASLWNNSEMWRQINFDQYVEMQGKTGVGGGYFLKEHSVDRFIKRRAGELIAGTAKRLLDVGCGGGGIVEELRTHGIEAHGCDVGIDSANTPNWIFQADIESGQGLGENRYEVVVLNLVLPWIERVDRALKNIHSICSDDAVVIATMQVPEFSKNGRFLEIDDDISWVIEHPVRRNPFLTMINHSVGPLLYYPRTLPDYINEIISAGFIINSCRYIFLDSEMNGSELEMTLSEWPNLQRHIKFPNALVIEFGVARLN